MEAIKKQRKPHISYTPAGYLSRREVAAVFGICVGTLHRWIVSGVWVKADARFLRSPFWLIDTVKREAKERFNLDVVFNEGNKV